MDKRVSKKFFLISFIPAIAYWYLEANYSVRIAVTVGLILSSIEIVVEKIFTKHVHSLSKINFFLIFFLGGISLIEDQGLWFKLQPSLTGLGIGLFILIKAWKGKGPLIEMMEDFNQNNMPEDVAKLFEKHIGIFFIAYGLFMAPVAMFLTTDKWLFFKTGGFYIIFLVFSILEILYLRRLIKNAVMQQRKQELFARVSATPRQIFDK